MDEISFCRDQIAPHHQPSFPNPTTPIHFGDLKIASDPRTDFLIQTSTTADVTIHVVDECKKASRFAPSRIRSIYLPHFALKHADAAARTPRKSWLVTGRTLPQRRNRSNLAHIIQNDASTGRNHTRLFLDEIKKKESIVEGERPPARGPAPRNSKLVISSQLSGATKLACFSVGLARLLPLVIRPAQLGT